jgi:hypothetical protein
LLIVYSNKRGIYQNVWYGSIGVTPMSFTYLENRSFVEIHQQKRYHYHKQTSRPQKLWLFIASYKWLVESRKLVPTNFSKVSQSRAGQILSILELPPRLQGKGKS